MGKWFNIIIQKASWKKAALYTILFGALYILINFSSIGVAGLLKLTNGANILDFEFGYTRESAFQMLTALGAEGRTFYLTKILPMDFLFPFSYMLFYSGWMALLLKQIAPKGWIRYLICVPVLAMLFDWCENIGIIGMINSYPNLYSWAVVMGSVASILKMVFTFGSIGIIGILFVIFIVKRIFK